MGLDSRRRLFGLAAACIGVLFLWQSHYRLSVVLGQSMRPTFHTGDLLLVDKRAYRKTDPRRGDLVVARLNKEFIVKRVVALPGETAEVKQGALLIDGLPIKEAASINLGPLDIGRGKLSKGKFALLGDNRALSANQIVHAIVSKDQIVGKVIFSIRLRRPQPPAERGT